MNVFVPDTVKYEKDATILYITIFLLHIYISMQRDVLEKDIIGFERQKMPGFLIIWYFDKRVELETKYSKYITTKAFVRLFLFFLLLNELCLLDLLIFYMKQN